MAAELKLSLGRVSQIINKDSKNKKARQNTATKIEGRATVELSVAIDWLNRQKQCDLLLTDPPYSTDIDDIESVPAWVSYPMRRKNALRR